MASKELYDLAFQYKKTRLWKKLFEAELYAVALPDGEIGYCSVMGILGEHLALGVYVGAVGLDSYRNLAFSHRADDLNKAIRQSCLQCSFENKDYLSEEEVEEVRSYVREHGITLRGPHAWPHFLKYVPNRLPWPLTDEEDEHRIQEALSAAIALAGMLEKQKKRDLGLEPVQPDTTDIPLLERQGDGFVLKRTTLPPPAAPSWPVPGKVEEKRLAHFRRQKKKGIFECEIVSLPSAILEEEGEVPFFPSMLLCADKHFVLPVEPVLNYEEHPDDLLNAFLTGLEENHICPAAVKVRDEAARALLEDFCAGAGILLSMDDRLPALDEARESLFEALRNGGTEEEFDFVEELMELSDQELRSLPREVAAQLLALAEMGILPPDLARRIWTTLST